MNSAEECYLKNYTLYGVYEREDSVQERDPMEAGEVAWEMANGR